MISCWFNLTFTCTGLYYKYLPSNLLQPPSPPPKKKKTKRLAKQRRRCRAGSQGPSASQIDSCWFWALPSQEAIGGWAQVKGEPLLRPTGLNMFPSVHPFTRFDFFRSTLLFILLSMMFFCFFGIILGTAYLSHGQL